MLLFHETADITRPRPVLQRSLTKALLGEPFTSTMRRRPLFLLYKVLKGLQEWGVLMNVALLLSRLTIPKKESLIY